MQRTKRLLRWWPFLALIVVGAVAAVVALRLTAGAAETDLPRVFTVERGNIVAAISPTGEVYTPRQAKLSFDVNRIELIEVNVEPGQEVKAGDVLARIDVTLLERAVTQAESDLTVAEDNLEKVRNPYSELDLMQAKLPVEQTQLALEEAKESLEEVRRPGQRA